MGTHHKGTSEEVAALDAYIKLMRCSESLTTRLQPGLDRAGLTVSRFGVLEALHHLGPLRSSQLAKKILKTGGNLTLVVRNLERDGLVRRERDRTDSRAYRIHLTAAGERLISRVFAEHLRNVVREFSALSLEEQAELARLCKMLGKHGINGKP
ncbi:MAG: MarR family transcriptional regulator [Acidobacteriales bacterium]|nr:MarR family transcriptional regulator [Terriglobales bacterium]